MVGAMHSLIGKMSKLTLKEVSNLSSLLKVI